HPAQHAHCDRKPNRSMPEHAEVLSRITQLIAVVGTQKRLHTHSFRAISTFVMKLHIRRKVDVPSFRLEAFAKIDVFVPRGIKLLIESTDVFICIAANQKGGRCRLLNFDRNGHSVVCICTVPLYAADSVARSARRGSSLPPCSSKRKSEIF